jgi:hypothetical protein
LKLLLLKITYTFILYLWKLGFWFLLLI